MDKSQSINCLKFLRDDYSFNIFMHELRKLVFMVFSVRRGLHQFGANFIGVNHCDSVMHFWILVLAPLPEEIDFLERRIRGLLKT